MDFGFRAPWRSAPAGWRWRALQELECGWRRKARFLVQSYLRADALAPMVQARPGSSLHRYVQERPEAVGFLIWPYQCASWGPQERLRRIVEHFDILDEIGPPFPFGVEDKLMLWSLEEYSPGVRIILDQPKWLFREGMLALNLFCGDHRAYSLAFSLYREGQGVGAFIGGLQGRNTEGALELYKDLTKSFHGMRPRDLLLDCLRMIVPALKVQRLLAVADDHRYLRHSYFGGGHSDHADYDAAWVERGGARVDPSHFELPLAVSLRDLEQVPSKKRAVYRRRNEMLESLQSAGGVLRAGQFVRFEAT
jgi:uncharacterized protein